MVSATRRRELHEPYTALHPDMKKRQTDGTFMITTPEEQVALLAKAWDEVSQKEEAQLGLLTNRKKAQMVLEMTGMQHTPERVLHLLGVNPEPRHIGHVGESRGGWDVI